MNASSAGTSTAVAPDQGVTTERPARLELAKRAAPWILGVAAALPLIVLVAHELWVMRVQSASTTDFAVSEIATRSALHLDRYVGPYSRFGWSHPGPAVFYWFVPLYQASGEQFGGLTAAAALLNLVWASLIVAIADRIAGLRGAAASAAALLLLFVTSGAERWRWPWGPEMIILPIALALLCGAAVVAGHRWALVLLVVAASFAAQTHIGAVPLVVMVLVVSCTAALVVHRAELRRWIRPAAVAVAAGAVMWAPPVYDQLFHRHGNLHAILTYFRHSKAPHQSPRTAVEVVVSQVSFAKVRDILGGIPPRGGLDAWSIALFVALVGLVAAGFVLSARRRARFQAALCGLSLLSVPVAIVSVWRVEDVLYAYLTTFVLAAGLCLWTAALLTIGGLLEPARRRVSPLVRSSSAVVALLALVAGGGLVVARWRHVGPAGAGNRDATVEQFAARIESLTRRGSHIRISIGSNPEWTTTAGVINQLERSGHHVEVDPAWVFMFGPDHSPTPETDHAFLVTAAAAPKPAGAKMLARGGTIQVGPETLTLELDSLPVASLASR